MEQHNIIISDELLGRWDALRAACQHVPCFSDSDEGFTRTSVALRCLAMIYGNDDRYYLESKRRLMVRVGFPAWLLTLSSRSFVRACDPLLPLIYKGG
jgi:hypothetical protein